MSKLAAAALAAEQTKIASVIGKVRRRLRLQRALDAATTSGLLWLLGLTVLVYLLKARMIDLDQLWAYGALATALPLLAGVIAAARPVRISSAAKLIDDTHGLHDRLGTAYEFAAEAEPSDFMRAQVKEALTHLPGIRPGRAAPFRRPRDLAPLGLLVLCLAFVVVLRFPQPPQPVFVPKPVALLQVDPQDLAPHRNLLDQLKLEAQHKNLPEMQELAKKLNKLFDELEKKKLTRKELFAKLAQLEKQMLDALDKDFDDLMKKLKEMGNELNKDKLTKDLAKALKHADLERAKKEMEALAKQLDKLSKRDKQRLSKTLKRASEKKLAKKDLQKQVDKLNKELAQLKRRLARKQTAAERKQLKRRLDRKRRQLQRLNQQQQRQAAQRRQLERLNKELADAAANMINKLDPKSRKALEALMKAAQQMQRFANEINKRRMMAKAQGNLQDLKEFLRRLGKGGKIRMGRLEDFMRRAGGKSGKGGKDGKDGKGGKGGKGGKDLVLMPGGQGGVPLPMPGMGPGQQPGQQPGGQQPGGQQPGGQGQQPGKGIGTGSDPNVKGDATKLAARRKDVFVKGKEGKGPNRSQVILGAADRGFSTANYRRVYRDYTQIIEDVMKREQVPLGYRYYIKRYFQLIKPR